MITHQHSKKQGLIYVQNNHKIIKTHIGRYAFFDVYLQMKLLRLNLQSRQQAKLWNLDIIVGTAKVEGVA